jgi:hypothetical protein
MHRRSNNDILFCRLITYGETVKGIAVRHIRVNGNAVGLAVCRDSAHGLLHLTNCLAVCSIGHMRQLPYMVLPVSFMFPRLYGKY